MPIDISTRNAHVLVAMDILVYLGWILVRHIIPIVLELLSSLGADSVIVESDIQREIRAEHGREASRRQLGRALRYLESAGAIHLTYPMGRFCISRAPGFVACRAESIPAAIDP